MENNDDSNPDNLPERAGQYAPIDARQLPDDPAVLAAAWSNRDAWGTIGTRGVRGELAELAVVAELSRWMNGWLPVLIHASFFAGALNSEVITASGIDIKNLFSIWLDWAIEQRAIWDATGGEQGMSPDEIDRVLDAMGVGTDDSPDVT